MRYGSNLWGLTEQERLLALGGPSRSTFYGWVKAARAHRDPILPTDTLIRISAALGIHKALRILFLTEREGVEWLRGPHLSQPFGGQSPMDLVTGGMQDGLMAVRRFLDAARGGLWMAPSEADRDAAALRDDDIVFA